MILVASFNFSASEKSFSVDNDITSFSWFNNLLTPMPESIFSIPECFPDAFTGLKEIELGSVTEEYKFYVVSLR